MQQIDRHPRRIVPYANRYVSGLAAVMSNRSVSLVWTQNSRRKGVAHLDLQTQRLKQAPTAHATGKRGEAQYRSQ
jgi:hypothetical protein